MIGEGLKVNSRLEELDLVRRFGAIVFVWTFFCWNVLRPSFHFYSDRLLQSKQSSGPFNFVACSSLMRGCRNLRELSFDCCDWSACVASESWGELPVPPAAVIARGTQGVFEYVKSSVISVRGKKVLLDCHVIDLKSWDLKLDELTMLLASFSVGKFLWLLNLNLVSSVCVQNYSRFFSLMCRRMEIASRIEAQR
jgi:hypothetical protein